MHHNYQTWASEQLSQQATQQLSIAIITAATTSIDEWQFRIADWCWTFLLIDMHRSSFQQRLLIDLCIRFLGRAPYLKILGILTLTQG
jgi:hypothetical protein